MRNPDHFEIAIIGGGPAGICAAIRLLSFGRSVALIESEVFPRRQIGEHLSPGIWNIFNFLNADHILAGQPAYLRGLPARIIWNERNKQQAVTEHNQSIMVDRSIMDKDLLDMASKLGLALFQPAFVESCERTTIGWKLNIHYCKETRKLTSELIIDARGHRGINAVNKISISPLSVALWIETRRPIKSNEVILEAVDDGWLWGSPLPNNNFRIMAMVDAKELSRQRPDNILRRLLKKSYLLGRAKIDPNLTRVKACVSQSYFHSVPWLNNYVQLGESAFSIDPLSSTGVEKAMRFSLQSAVAINHFLKSGDEQVPRIFYEDQLVESVATHSIWAQGFYSQAWANGMFWQSRSRFDIHEENNRSMLFSKVSSKLAAQKQS